MLNVKGYSVTVDESMEELLLQKKWFIKIEHGIPRAATSERCGDGKRRNVYIHHYVSGMPLNKLEIDHINCDSLDNRRGNLRIVTRFQNASNQGIYRSNTSGHKGVVFNKAKRKFQAQIKHRGKLIYLGLYQNAQEAQKVYWKAALEFRGEFARAA